MEEKLKLSVPTNEGQNVVGEEELKTLGMSIGYKVFTASLILCCVSFTMLNVSCSVLSRTLTEEADFNYGYASPGEGNSDIDEMKFGMGHVLSSDGFGGIQTLDNSNYSYIYTAQFSGLHRPKEMDRIKRLENLKCATPSKSEKYDSLIQEQVSKMELARKERIQQRKSFLIGFYGDLYSLSQKEFTNKYKRNCSKSIKTAMKFLYEKNHGIKGYEWAIFRDDSTHKEDISFTEPDLKNIGKKEKYPYYWLDNPWYQVQLGNNNVKIRIVGKDKNIVITGIINPALKIVALDN